MQLKRGVRLGRPFGIPLVVHGSWFPAVLLLVFHFTYTAYVHLPRPLAVPLAVVSALAFFASLVAHEYGHALVARSLGIPVVDITLFVFGGVARIAREPSRPSQEIVVAGAGPLVSFALAGAAFAAAGGGIAGELLRTLGFANLAVGCFNLLPGFPLDGGRILRAAIWARTGAPHRAALAAGRSGQAIGALLAAGGLALFVRLSGAFEGLWLVVVGAFLWTLATSSRRAARVAARLDSQDAGSWARPFAGTLPADAPLSALVGAGPYAVSADGRLAGVLIPGPRAAGVRAADAMVPWSSTLAFRADEPVTRALERLSTGRHGLLVVVDDAGAVVGFLDHDGVRARLTGDGRA